MSDGLEKKPESVGTYSLTERNRIAKSVIEQMKAKKIEPISRGVSDYNSHIGMMSFGFIMKLWINHSKQNFQMTIEGRGGQLVRREPGDSEIMKEIHNFLYENGLINDCGLFDFEVEQKMTCIKIEV